MEFLDQGLPTRRLRDNLAALDEFHEDWFQERLTAFKHGHPDDVRMAEEVVKNLREQGPLAKLRKFSEHVDMRPDVQAGRPIIKGTRIETATIAGYEQTGMSKKEIAETLWVAEDQVGAALDFERALAAGLA